MKISRQIKEDISNYFGRITSTRCPFFCRAKDKPVTYDAKDPTAATGAISVQM